MYKRNRYTTAIKILLIAVSFISCPLHHATGNEKSPAYFYFKQLSGRDGLSSNFVRDIMLDYNGFFWFGTRAGLSRFDMHDFRNYYSVPDSVSSLPDDYIQFIFEDGTKKIWVSTQRGLCRYNKETDTFTPVTHGGKILQARSYMLVEGGIIFGGAQGTIYKYDYTRAELAQVPLKWDTPTTHYINYVSRWKKGTWIISSRWDGIWTVDTVSWQVKRAGFCTEKSIMSIKTGTNGTIWVSPYGKGLYKYDSDGKIARRYNTTNSGLINNIIIDMEECNNELWLATDGGGINILNTEEETFSNIRYIPGDKHSFPVSSVYCLYKDKYDNMWVGTIRGGVFGIRNVDMKTYQDVPNGSTQGMSNKTVLCLLEEESGIIWVGTDGGGINRLDPQTERFTHYPTTYGAKISSIAEWNKDELIISSFAKGLYIFNKKSGSLRPFILYDPQEDEAAFLSGISVDINNYAPGKLHFYTDIIYTYDIPNRKFSKVSLPDSIRLGDLQQIYAKGDTTYLYTQKTIFALDNKTNTISNVYKIKNFPYCINAVAKGCGGIFWIGTDAGLFCFDSAADKLTHIPTSMFRDVTFIINVGDYLWLGGRSGALFRYSIKKGLFVIFGESDGATSNEYLSKPILRSRKNGDIYIGGISGLLRIDGSKYKEQPDIEEPNIDLIDVQLDGKSVVNKTKNAERFLEVPGKHSSLTAKVMVKEKDIFREKIYRFHLTGTIEKYSETYNPYIELGILPVGEYQLSVSINMKNGEWSPTKTILSINVVPPWYATTWFIILLVLTVLFIIYAIVSYIEKERRNKLMIEKKEQERQLSEDKVRFMISMSHELRTPLTLIYTPLKKLLGGTIPDTGLKKQLSRVFNQVCHMRNTINMILDIRRMEVEKTSIEVKPYKFNNWIETVADDFYDEFQHKGITLQLEQDDAIEEVQFDKERLEMVMSNLLMNALKFSPEGSTTTLTTKKNGDKIRVSVKDRGIGLTPKDLDHLFIRFYQGEHKMFGSGIGLSYSKTLVELHGGTIGAYNNDDGGATFWFELPLQYKNGEIADTVSPRLNDLFTTEADIISEAPPEDYPLNNYNLLFVDDEKDLCTFIKEAFTGVFKCVYTASNGVEALEKAYKYPFDIIISDVMMPEMDGFEFCRRLKNDVAISHIPVILLTARTNSQSVTTGYKLGADFYLSKPFDSDLLLTIIRNIFRNRENIKKRYRDTVSGVVLPSEQTFSNADEQFLLKLNSYIVNNLDNPAFGVHSITVEMGMSRASLYSKIKALTDLGVNDYVNRIRIEQAMILLEKSDMTIAEVSERVGFSTPAYFSTSFKHFTTLSPSAYKNTKQNKT